jgi:hypothetical protein
MKSLLRVMVILIDPSAEWPRIEKEPGDPAYLLLTCVAPLAFIPALFGLIGASVIGVVVPGAGLLRASLFDGIFGAIFGYLENFALVFLLGLFTDLAATLFGGRRNFANAFKLAVYSYVPVWLTGTFLLLPGLRFLMLAGFYGVYLLLIGLPLLTKTPAHRSAGFAALVVAFACALTFIAATAQYELFGTPGF